jgi:hypothetical protein
LILKGEKTKTPLRSGEWPVLVEVAKSHFTAHHKPLPCYGGYGADVLVKLNN